jgi:hypothetical protein
MIWEGARDHDLDWSTRVSLFGPLLLIAISLGAIAGVAIVVFAP